MLRIEGSDQSAGIELYGRDRRRDHGPGFTMQAHPLVAVPPHPRARAAPPLDTRSGLRQTQHTTPRASLIVTTLVDLTDHADPVDSFSGDPSARRARADHAPTINARP